ncbi:hypothetical protein BU24DRAFT_448564 [Aaosphaeria arxii CBS 175.79]|uniref:N-acetyltransferase domain-containing protein n=1 Tax=Aaosphaeria arxii CBS 175.79 TaxID=1450172 RepID=A0A6A5Y6R9_9PLEO|nr:uncharacterized protein BU24DRAFT_448564 [Aaosphaeria arxii CBS 175.79]KAF2020254.1 hypothetical protein BU24DRAFT_448564 [Aaosphaeria arxii CBS 175.79]
MATPSPPTLSPPILYTPQDLRANLPLAQSIINLGNEAFKRSKLPAPEKWYLGDHKRFPTPQHLIDMVGEQGVMAVIHDDSVPFEGLRGKVIACAAILPWKGGWEGEGKGVEEGWEFKAVCVDGGERYLKRGLVGTLSKVLEEWVLERTDVEKRGELRLWILAADCINGVYWRKRGFREVRRKTQGQGVWGCKTSFEMVVFVKEIELS